MHYFWIELCFLVAVPIVWLFAIAEGLEVLGKMRYRQSHGYEKARVLIWIAMGFATAVMVAVFYSILSAWMK